MLNEGNQIYNFISSSGSGTIISYGSGSDFLTSYASGPVPLVKKLRFRFRFHNAACGTAGLRGCRPAWRASAVVVWSRAKDPRLAESPKCGEGIIRMVRVSGNAIKKKICFVNLP